MLAPAITRLLRAAVAPRASWVREDCHLGAGVRFDLAAIVEGELHGYEVKSDADRLARLALPAESQVVTYGRVCDRVTLVAAPRHIAKALTIIPAWWGVLRVDADGLAEVRPAGVNPDDARLRLARQLWVTEGKPLAREHGVGRGVSHKFGLADCLATLPESVLREALCDAIPKRPWREARRRPSALEMSP